jgi:translation elongation factor EF-1alpha
MPINEKVIVKNIIRNKESIKCAYAGDNVEIVFKNIDITKLSFGQILCPTNDLVKVANKFSARIEIFEIDRPIIKGFFFFSQIK